MWSSAEESSSSLLEKQSEASLCIASNVGTLNGYNPLYFVKPVKKKKNEKTSDNIQGVDCESSYFKGDLFLYGLLSDHFYYKLNNYILGNVSFSLNLPSKPE